MFIVYYDRHLFNSIFNKPITAIYGVFILWLLVLVELFLGGGFDDDNDDQDGGMLPAYFKLRIKVNFHTDKFKNLNFIALNF